MIYEPAQEEQASVADGLLPDGNIGIIVNKAFIKDRITWTAGLFSYRYKVDRSFSDNPTIQLSTLIQRLSLILLNAGIVGNSELSKIYVQKINRVHKNQDNQFFS